MVSAERLAVIREYLERKGTLPDLYARELLAARDALAARVEALEGLLRELVASDHVAPWIARTIEERLAALAPSPSGGAERCQTGFTPPIAGCECKTCETARESSGGGAGMGGMAEDAFVIAACGPSSSRCRCACPADCEHVWDGPWRAHEDGRGGSATCSRCHMDMLDHDRWVMP